MRLLVDGVMQSCGDETVAKQKKIYIFLGFLETGEFLILPKDRFVEQHVMEMTIYLRVPCHFRKTCANY